MSMTLICSSRISETGGNGQQLCFISLIAKLSFILFFFILFLTLCLRIHFHCLSYPVHPNTLAIFGNSGCHECVFCEYCSDVSAGDASVVSVLIHGILGSLCWKKGYVV